MPKSLLEELDDTGVLDRVCKPPPLPATVTSFLGRLSLLYGVPLPYLLPDEKLLPPESVRLFFIDPQWVDALVDGALSVGRAEDVLLLLNKAMAGNYIADIVSEARAVRRRAQGGPEAPDGRPTEGGDTVPSYAFTGFVLRSRLLAGWPGLEVRAYRQQQARLVLRLERPAPDVLLCVVDGEFDALQITQPPEGLHFGLHDQITQTQIGPDIDATLDDLVAGLNASKDATIAKCSYVADKANKRLTITFKEAGLSGNEFTLAADDKSKGKISGPKLSGGDGPQPQPGPKRASGYITFSDNPGKDGKITLNGVAWTFVAQSFLRDKNARVLDVKKLASADGSAALAKRMIARPLRYTFSLGDGSHGG